MLTEDTFKDLVHTELSTHPAPTFAELPGRAVAGGRRRARRRAVARTGAGVASVALIAGIAVSADGFGPHDATSTGPAGRTPSMAGPQESPAPAHSTLPHLPALPTQPVPPNSLAQRILDILFAKLPSTSQKVGYTSTAPDAGIAGGMSWDTGAGAVDVMLDMRPQDWFKCHPGGWGWGKTDAFGGQLCRTEPDGTVLETRTDPLSQDRALIDREVRLVVGRTVVSLSFANGPRGAGAEPTRATLPLTDLEAVAILKDPLVRDLVTAYEKG